MITMSQPAPPQTTSHGHARLSVEWLSRVIDLSLRRVRALNLFFVTFSKRSIPAIPLPTPS